MVSSSPSSLSVATAPEAYGYDQLHIDVSGPADGPPVVLLHGWGSSAQLMRPLADGLKDACRIANIDLPGHGGSPPPPEPWGVPEYAALVDAYLRATFAEPVTLVGHSNGGRIGLYLASEPAHADRIARMVLVSPSGITPRRTWTYYLRKYTATALKAPFLLLPPALREPGLDWLRHSLVWKLLGSSDYQALQGVMRETFVKTVTFHVDDRLDRIAVPVLLFWGDQDTAISRHQMETLEHGLQDAGLVVLEGAGHYGYLDDPDTVIAGTRHFLEQSVPAA